MHIGETMLVLGAMVIFSAATLNINSAKLENEQNMMETEFRITAMGIAQSYIEETRGLLFDEALTDTMFSGPVPDAFTSPALLGPESGEVYPDFDDFDDYNNLSQNVTTPRADYNVNVIVSYTDSVSLLPQSAGQTSLKIIDVKVTSVYYQDTVSCKHLAGFYD